MHKLIDTGMHSLPDHPPAGCWASPRYQSCTAAPCARSRSPCIRAGPASSRTHSAPWKPISNVIRRESTIITREIWSAVILHGRSRRNMCLLFLWGFKCAVCQGCIAKLWFIHWYLYQRDVSYQPRQVSRENWSHEVTPYYSHVDNRKCLPVSRISLVWIILVRRAWNA